MNCGWSCEEDLFPITDGDSVLLTVSWHPRLQPRLLIRTHFERQKHTSVFSQETIRGNRTTPINKLLLSERWEKSQLAGGDKCDAQNTTKHLLLAVKYSKLCFLSDSIFKWTSFSCGHLRSEVFPMIDHNSTGQEYQQTFAYTGFFLSIHTVLGKYLIFTNFSWNTKLSYGG